MKSTKRLFRDAMSHTPMFLRRILTEQKIRSMLSFMMPLEEVLKCDEDPTYKMNRVEAQKGKHPKEARWLERKIKKSLDLYPSFKNMGEIERKRMVDQMEYAFFGYGFYPDEFLFFDLGGENSDLSRFRTFVSETERWTFRFAANDFTNSLLSDKADTYRKFKKYYKRDAVIIDNKKAFPQFADFIGKHPMFVYKNTSSSRGDGVKLVNGVENKEEFFDKMLRDGKVLLEECIVQSKEMSVFNDSSVNTVRLSTYNTRNGVLVKHGFFRTGRKGVFIDNAAKGGIFAVVDVENGTIISEGYDEYGSKYSSHPDSGVAYRGYSFPDWEDAKAVCREIAKEIPSVKYISFDLSHTSKGWVIVEVNPSGQYLHQAGQPEGFRRELGQLIENMDLMAPYELRKFD